MTNDDGVLLRDKRVLVMGGGRFGANALEYLTANNAQVLVTDLNPDCTASSKVDVEAADLGALNSLANGQSALLVGDAVDSLLVLLETTVPDLVVTAIPGNAVARLVEKWSSKRGYKFEPYPQAVSKVLENIPTSLVSFVNEPSAVIVVSYMPSNMRCRDGCMPPKGFCATTGRPKLAPMNKLLEFAAYNNTDFSRILWSRDLTGGLGAIDGKELFSLLKRLEAHRKSFTLSIGTACDCHGILNHVKIAK